MQQLFNIVHNLKSIKSHLIYNIDDFGIHSEGEGAVPCQVLAEASFEPHYRPWGIGLYRKIDGTDFRYAWLPSIKVQAGRVIEGVSSTQFSSGDNYTRIGAAAEFFLRYNSRFEAHAKYEILYDLQLNEQIHHLLTLGMDYLILPKNPNLTLSVEYQKGTTPVKFQEIEKLTVGIGIKF